MDAADRLVMPARGRPAPLPGRALTTPAGPAEVTAGLEPAFAWYDAELPGLVAVTRAAARHGHHDIAWRLPVAMRGLVELHCLGDTLTGLGRHLEALACLRTALAVFRQLGNTYGEAAAAHSIGLAWQARGRPRYAERYLRRAIALYQELGRASEAAAAAWDLAATSA